MPASSEVQADGTVILNKPVTLPPVLDLLIVGGGPGGTSAAFRAKENGLAALVVDYDDLMKRIREYAKDKLILPNFGGGDKMKFPKGGPLSSLLHFTDIDKDDMVIQWKKFYRENNVPAQIGIELTGLQKGPNGIWDVKCWNHNTRTEQRYATKHVALCIGRGVPRRFDIPGDTAGISYRLADAANYVGVPSCVIGGGTSAAEAVISISNAKIKADDKSLVFWSYRGDKLPRVSKALAEVFFEAYIGNGNIRYFPLSEPTAIVTAEDRKEYLSIRTDRKSLPDRPNETHHLEFRKEYCVACIGEDIPEAFLNSMGISMATGGPNNKKRMIVTPNLETQQPNVFLIGDILSQAYFEVEDFNADPSTFREVTHRGNCKSAIRDGFYIAEVVTQRVRGNRDAVVIVEDAEEGAVPAVSVQASEAPAEFFKTMAKAVESPGPPQAAFEPARRVEEAEARLVRMLGDNVQENEYPIKLNGTTTIGRIGADISFPEDNLLSDIHASILHDADGYFLRDDGSSSGVFLKVTETRPIELTPGTIILAGKQFLLFSADGGFVLHHFDRSGKEVNRYNLAERNYVLGREAPDITLDSQDLTLSRRHLAIYVKDKKVFVKDLLSANGTFLKVKTRIKLEQGDQFRVGKSTFKFALKEEPLPRFATVRPGTLTIPKPAAAPPPQPVAAAPAPAPSRPAPAPQAPPPAPAAAPAAPAAAPAPAAASGELTVNFKNVGKTLTFKKGQSITELAEEHGLKINAECHAGICGSDPIRIISGGENLNEVGSGESDTLQDICGLKPGECRLACVTKPKGAVTVEIISQ